MPQHSSVEPSDSRNAGEGVRLSNLNSSSPSGQADNIRNGGGSSNNYSHMTLDGRRRHRHARNGSENASRGDESEHWNDWTNTWRRIGTKGQSQSVTMTGTITRGKKKGQVVDVQLDLTDRELMEISTVQDSPSVTTPETPDSIPSSGFEPKTSQCGCGLGQGPHILMLSILAFPFIIVGSLFVSFYFGALTWQNIFTHFYEERTIWHKIFLCPLLVLSFPLFVVLFTVGISIYAGFVQIRWSFMNWKNEVGSLEKGFYGWLCGKLGLDDCSPYTVVELFSSNDVEREQTQEASGCNGNDGRMAVVYTEQRSSQRSSHDPRSRNSLPSSQGHTRMQRVESTM